MIIEISVVEKGLISIGNYLILSISKIRRKMIPIWNLLMFNGLTYHFAPIRGVGVPFMSDKTYGLPAVPVKERVKDGVTDTRSADVDSVYREIKYIHNMLGVE